MARSFEESHQAYANGDGARAKELSNKGKRHQAEMERLNREASEWIFVGASSLFFRALNEDTERDWAENNKVRLWTRRVWCSV